MKTTTIAIAAAGVFALAAVSSPNDEQAQCRGCGLGFGFLGGVVAGTIIGGPIARSAYPAYGGGCGICTLRWLHRACTGRLPSPAGPIIHRAPTATGCMRFFATYSPILWPMSWPTLVENR